MAFVLAWIMLTHFICLYTLDIPSLGYFVHRFPQDVLPLVTSAGAEDALWKPPAFPTEAGFRDPGDAIWQLDWVYTTPCAADTAGVSTKLKAANLDGLEYEYAIKINKSILDSAVIRSKMMINTHWGYGKFYYWECASQCSDADKRDVRNDLCYKCDEYAALSTVFFGGDAERRAELQTSDMKDEDELLQMCNARDADWEFWWELPQFNNDERALTAALEKCVAPEMGKERIADGNLSNCEVLFRRVPWLYIIGWAHLQKGDPKDIDEIEWLTFEAFVAQYTGNRRRLIPEGVLTLSKK